MNEFEMDGALKVDVDAGDVVQGIFGNIFNSKGTKECGARPTCMGWSEGCKQKQQAYYECNKVAQASKASVFGSVAKVAVIGAIVLGAIIVVAIMFKRK